MLMSSESASLCRSVSFTSGSFLKSCLDSRNHLLPNKWFVYERERARVINQLTRRTLNISACNDHQHLRVHLTQFHQHIQSVHTFHHEIEQNQTRLFEKVNFERSHAIVSFNFFV